MPSSEAKPEKRYTKFRNDEQKNRDDERVEAEECEIDPVQTASARKKIIR